MDKYIRAVEAAEKVAGTFRIPIADLVDVFAEIPAADVVPVVHCKDCKNSYEDIGGRICAYGVCVDCAVPDDFFCALAERKDGDSNVHSDQRPEKRN